VFFVGVADNLSFVAADALSGTVTCGVGPIRSINLVKYRVVDITSECIDNGIEVDFQPVRG